MTSTNQYTALSAMKFVLGRTTISSRYGHSSEHLCSGVHSEGRDQRPVAPFRLKERGPSFHQISVSFDGEERFDAIADRVCLGCRRG